MFGKIRNKPRELAGSRTPSGRRRWLAVGAVGLEEICARLQSSGVVGKEDKCDDARP